MTPAKNPNSNHDPKSNRQKRRIARGIQPHSIKPRLLKRVNAYFGEKDVLTTQTTSHGGHVIQGRGAQKMW